MREAHELNCAGHLIEAAVAYYGATGKARLLGVARRLADPIDRTFGPEPGKLRLEADGQPWYACACCPPNISRLLLSLGRYVYAADGDRAYALCLRIPRWCAGYSCRVNGEARGGQELDLDMPVTLLRSDPRLRAAAGKAAIKRGPLAYCIEETDNGKDLHGIRLAEDPEWSIEPGAFPAQGPRRGVTVVTE